MDAVACPEPQVIQRFALGCLSEEESLALEQHLTSCPRCSRRLQAADTRGDQLLQAVRDRPGEVASPEAVAALLPVLRALRPPSETPTVAAGERAGGETLPPETALPGP